jgi:hypothetical protein
LRLDLYHHIAGAQVLEEILATLDDHRAQLDQLRRYQEQLMATSAEILALVAQVKAYVDTLKAAQPDPADQGLKDQIAAELQGILPAPPPAPPA